MQRNSTIGELMERKRIQDGAKEYQGHTYMDLARFDDATKHMIIFDVLTDESPVGWKGERNRLYLSDVGYQKALDNQKAGNIKIISHAAVAKLDRFAENFDPYEYVDQVDDVQTHIQEIKADLAAGNTAPYREFLNTAIEEAREETAVEVAKVLKSQLDKIDSPKRESVMEKLAQAAEKAAPASPSPKRKEPER